MTTTVNHSKTAARKLEAFFVSLPADEQAVISQMVRSALLHAADPRMNQVAEDASGFSGPSYAEGITLEDAPEIVQSIAGRVGSTPPPVYKTWSC